MIIRFADFSGIKPKIDLFALPWGSAQSCSNVAFESGGVSSVIGVVFPANTNGESFDLPTEEEGLVAGSRSPSDYISDSSSLRIMAIGDGAYFRFPQFEYSTDGVVFNPVLKSNYRLFRSYNHSAFKEVAVPTDQMTPYYVPQ